MLALAAGLTVPGAAMARTPSLTARAAVVMDAGTGEVLWERNCSAPLPPASTTKVMTSILALESGRLDENFRVSEDAAETAPSKINLRAGQRMRLRSLVYATLLNSANDAATVVAEGLAGSERAFAARMNEKAREIGARSSHFVNPHGLTAEGHVASARDLALIFRYGLGVPLFRQVLETRRIEVPLEGPGMHLVALHSHNRLLTGYTYPVIGKTGYTRPARRCFVGAARHEEREIVIALLGSTDLWGDARRLFSFAFDTDGDRPHVVMAGALPSTNLLHRPTAATSDPRPTSEGDDEANTDEDAPAGGRYTVQLGPYASRDVALATRARLSQRGYTAALAGRLLRIGSFTTLARARHVAGRLRSTGYHPLVVARQ